MKRTVLGLVALAASVTPALSAGETPSIDGAPTRTYAQVAQGATPAQPGGGATPAQPAAGQTPQVTPRIQFCGAVFDSYRKVLLSNPEMQNTKNPSWNGLIGVSATVARHETLARLLAMANSHSCDLNPFLTLEQRVIQSTYTSPEVR